MVCACLFNFPLTNLQWSAYGICSLNDCSQIQRGRNDSVIKLSFQPGRKNVPIEVAACWLVTAPVPQAPQMAGHPLGACWPWFLPRTPVVVLMLSRRVKKSLELRWGPPSPSYVRKIAVIHYPPGCGWNEEWLRELRLLSLGKKRLRRDLITPYSSMKGRCSEAKAIEWEVIASNCSRGGSSWILGKMYSLREW